MLDVRAHVEQCAVCRAEQESLSQTKRLLSSLSYTTPRAELEQMLVVRAERASNPKLLDRIMPPEWGDAMLWRWEGIGSLGSPRLRSLAATALLSLAGLCLATVSRPADESPFGDTPNAGAFAVYVGPTGTLTHIPLMPTVGDLARPDPNVISASLAPNASVGAAWQTMATPSLPASYRNSRDIPANWENDLIPPAHRPTPSFSRFNMSVVIVASRPH